ncbi:ACP S-malonyltransferase [Pseudalkalibacillus sp. SCS-8]|uniref:ACP S-malonyltransferase n=1 Tax=Pseudalkalibacillus nanhaiensis TaxID=3115291 RepID=UPI0032DB95F2
MQKVFFLMPGQGAQYVEMGKDICEKYPEVERIYDTANRVLGEDIKRMCFEADIDELTRTENTQIAVFLNSVAMYKALSNRYNLEPVGFAGHSLGEFSALVCAESLDLESAIRLVRKRGQFMQETSEQFPSKMVALRNISVQEIENHCRMISEKGSHVAIANYNSPNQVVITGYKNAVDEVVEKLTKLGADEIVVNVKTPFHTELMQSSADQFMKEIENVEIKHPKYEVIANLTGEPYLKSDDISDMLVKQIISPVKWIQTMEYVKSLNVDLVIDIGPKDIVKKLAKQNGIKTPTFAASVNDDMKTLTQKFLSPKTVVSFLSKALGLVVSLKNYNDNIEEYNEGVVKPYKRIEEMKRTFQNQSYELSEMEVNEVLSLLNTIFETKKTPLHEREKRIQDLMKVAPSPQENKDLITQ